MSGLPDIGILMSKSAKADLERPGLEGPANESQRPFEARPSSEHLGVTGDGRVPISAPLPCEIF
jgi:hypothetical protein